MAPSTYHPDAVTITLRSTRQTTYPTRNIILRPDEPVNVGRSSRSEAKNLSATTDNALFDCPVISRRHAEVELRINKWAEEKHQIFIKDTGSMHGTSVNGQKLVPAKPFQLKEGDTIRLGESVNRADNNYDGVTVTLHCISTATKKSTAQVKNTQQGISVPSDSESDFDDDDDSDGGADLHPSSAHTTPDGGNAKSDSQLHTGSSRSNVIMVEDDDDDEPVPLFSRRAPAQSNFIPDTYADDSVMAAELLAPIYVADAPHSSLQFSEAYAAIDESKDVRAAMAAAETAPSVDGDFDHEDVNSEDGDGARSHAWSDSDHFSEEGQDSDEHSDSHEDFDRQSFLSEEFNMTDDVAVEDDEDDEGPEIMSSKRRPSNELGTLGDEPNNVMSDTVREAAIPARPHYDPVRGFQVSAPMVEKFPAYRSNKWDVGPPPALEQTSINSYSYLEPPYQDLSTMASVFHATPVNYGEVVPFLEDPYPTSYNPAPANTDTTHLPTFSEPNSGLYESNSKKRKAPEISTSDEPVITTQSPASNEASETASLIETPVTAVPTTTASTEPQMKKRKIKQPHAQKSILRTAVIEAGKYTAGAIIGGIGLVTILASPIGEALASC